MKNFLSLFVLLYAPIIILAQTYKLAPYDSIQTKSSLRISLRYTSNYIYMGRSDSAQAPYLSPSIGYYHKSGFFARGSFSYLTAKDQGRIDLYSITGGYDYYGEKLALGVSLTEYIFNDESYVVQAEMSTYGNVFVGYDATAFMIFVDAGLGFSDGADYFLTLDFSRMFFTLLNRFTILPSFSMNAGTQKYYDQYYMYRSPQSGFGKGGNGNGKHGQPQPTATVSIEESENFQVLDYEASLQLTYKVNKLRFFTITTWTFPVNPATIVVDGVTEEEDLHNNLYWTAGVRLTLFLKQK